jgi:hypothetical protein
VTNGSGTLDVEVNGNLFATITMAPEVEPVFTGADGQPLTADELEALQNIFLVVTGGLDFFEDLLDPVT